MYLSQTIGTGRGSAQHFAVNGPKQIGTALIVGLALLIAASPQIALASVLANGDVLPADNPFTVGLNEGLPIDGNFINPFEPVDEQSFYEGIHDDNNVADPLDDDNINSDIIVGQKSFGVLLISGESALRFMNLIIGDEAELPNGQLRKGTGVVRITGIGSLYNNNPDIIPPGLPPAFSSVNPRTAEAGYEDGFDVYVGRAGTGTLEISAGARAEVHDAVVIGDLPGSSGSVIVDGFDSFLGSGGFEGAVIGEPRQMIVGRNGVGFLTISNGATVVSESTKASGTQETIVGAVIGSDAFDDEDPLPGGSGTATVTGLASKWMVGGSLQVGGFQRGMEGVFDDPEGDNVQYGNEVGRGTLHVNEGGFVGIRAAIDADPDQDDLLLAIGRFGRVELAGGLIVVGSGEIGDQGDPRQSSIQVLNDGVIRGFGRIETGVFRNRFFGEVRVDAGHKLVIDSSSEFVSDVLDAQPLANYGLIQVIGTAEGRAEIEFERAPTTDVEPVQPFRNLFLEDVPVAGRAVGQITGAHSTMRFRSGLSNNGKLAFIAGDNFVSGPVVNEAGDPDPMNFSPPGEIAVAGNFTTVTFEDTFVNNGLFDIFPNSSLVIFENDFTQGAAGTMALTLGGRPTGNELSFLSVMGDAILEGGTLEVDLFSTGANPIDPMPGDEYEILAAMGDLTGIFANLVMPNLGAGMAMIPFYDYAADTITLRVVGLAGVMGADFNGDGFVDALDLAVWQMNVGIIGGATGAQGDADGDGDVDGDDFLVWQRTIGPVPGGGAGSGAGGELVAGVPEPSSLLLVAIGSLALAARRRRS